MAWRRSGPAEHVSEEIAQAKRNKEDASAKIAAMRAVGEEIKELEARLKETEAGPGGRAAPGPQSARAVGAGRRRGRLGGPAHVGRVRARSPSRPRTIWTWPPSST